MKEVNTKVNRQRELVKSKLKDPKIEMEANARQNFETEKACKFHSQSENWKKAPMKSFIFFANCIAECVMTATVIHHVSHISLPNKEKKTGNSTRIPYNSN